MGHAAGEYDTRMTSIPVVWIVSQRGARFPLPYRQSLRAVLFLGTDAASRLGRCPATFHRAGERYCSHARRSFHDSP